MAKKKETKKVDKKAAVKSTVKSAPKKTAKPIAKPVAKASVKTVVKSAKNVDKKAVSKVSSKAEEKNKPEVVKKTEAKTTTKKNEIKDAGSTLIEMAKNEMAAIKIGQTEDSKVEKPGKLKAIKVERGNLSDEKAKWQELYKRYGKEKASPYKMSDSFEASRPLLHKVLGWGFILTNEDNRLEVLFENGIKMLISNYKPN